MKKCLGIVVTALAAVIALGFSASPANADTPGIIICVEPVQDLCIVIDDPEDRDDDPWH
ncbi:hypothetical protein [Nonomuraea jiangxiensis]|uniref:Peptidase inhibitor family I36 n=1 Tax=Nonomuraea jiangxiensis TaxID=633440 RepID=A0A1G9CPT7_9ACTN|nr:hypothetical protein [Nonomuraea jiangxiensis]SDK53628.1 hypothetical protein SAMN05421869_116228 [Nonomuraea jiangxiensis]